MPKLLVANRSEISIRVFRAATELGMRTVAVYSYEDRLSLHRFKADESYLIGPPSGGEPVRSYLNIDAIVAVARRHHVDAIHPGYGFLAENADFARACAAAGITFIGPTPAQLDRFGDKTAAKRLAARHGVPTVPGTDHGIKRLSEVKAAARQIGYPVIIKASFGGGGRGMRVVHRPEDLADRLEEAQREAGAAFGRSEVFIEKYIPRAKHIEVQLLGDQHGNLVHLWDRDCSIQRRHQKVVEIAPSWSLPLDLRREICEAAVRIARPVRYQCAGTVEFLLDLDTNRFYFIEVNPRIQVEHTVTEVVTGIDIVKSQILVSRGHRLHEDPVSIPAQEEIETRGAAIQCRITTEDPENQFIPDYGRLTSYRSPGGFAIRLDGGSAFSGAHITPYFDSLLVKITSWGSTLQESAMRMERSLREFRVRGVKTNIAFLENLILHPMFISGQATTSFIDSTPELFKLRPRKDRASKLLAYIGEVIVNGRPEVKPKYDKSRSLPPAPIPPYPANTLPPPGLRDQLRKLGPEKFAAWIRRQKRLFLTDTTLRDAHQSLLATRVRTWDMLQVAEAIAHSVPGYFSLEMWGGATFDTAMRFLQEDPWDRLRLLREKIPNIPFQMLLRASNAVGYTNYPDNVVREFIRRSAANGIDVFRIFDSLNWAENIKVAVRTVVEETDALCEASICYTGDILDPRRTKFSLKYYVKMARELVRMGTHILGIKDMAGLCKPYAAYTLVKALRDEVDVPIHFHTHDPGGISAGAVLRAADAGVDIADAALASMSGATSQPCLNSIVAALRNTPRDTGLDPERLRHLSDYWAGVREFYYPFEESSKSPSADIYLHEMPGGQYTNLRQQAISMGLGDRWPEVVRAYTQANQLFGDIVKVTPSSKVVGDMALFMVSNNLTPREILSPNQHLSFPRSVVEMMQGLLGQPEGGWPADIERVVLRSAGVRKIQGRPGAKLPKIDLAQIRKELTAKVHQELRDEDVLSSVLYPQVYLDFTRHRRKFGDTSVLPTPAFFYGLQSGEEISVEIEEGKSLVIQYATTSDLHDDGTRTVYFELNGQPRSVRVADQIAEGHVHKHPRADKDDPNHVGAPMPGKVSTVNVKKGDAIRKGQPLLSLEAMKMEAAVYAPRDTRIADILVAPGSIVETGDLLVVIE